MDPYTDLEPWQRLSASALDLWEKCPRHFHIERVLGIRSPAGIEAEIGHFGHQILEELMAADPEQRTIGAARDLARRLWPEYALSDAFKTLDLDENGAHAFKRAVWAGIEGFFKLRTPSEVNLASPDGPDGPMSARELPIQAQIGDAWVVGVVDRLDAGPLGDEVTDYKFGKVPDRRYLGPKLRQLRLYGAILRRMGVSEPRRGTLLYVTHRERVTELLTSDKIAGAEADVGRAWGQIQAAHHAGEWPAQPGPLCGWCPHVADCPAGAAEVRSRAAEGRLKPSAPARVALSIPT